MPGADMNLAMVFLFYGLVAGGLPAPQEPSPAEQQKPPAAAQPDQQPSAPPASGQPPAPSASPAEKKTPSSPAAPKKHTGKRKSKPSNGLHKVVVREGSTPETPAQLSPELSAEQASHQKQNADQLLASTETNLQRISGPSLNANQQAMVEQIRKFMEQARTAISAGDLQRGHNLALKAHLLSDELVPH